MEYTIIPSDKKGGRKTPGGAGIKLEHRETLWERLETLPKGSLFKPEDIIQEDVHMGDDFVQMRDHDYVHVCNGWFTPIDEGRYVRGLPRPTKVAQNWLNRFDHHDTLVEFGDWTAYRIGLYPWEPIAGYRFRCKTSQAVSILTLGHMKIRIQLGPDWLLDNSEQGLLFRALHDMPHKTFGSDIYKWSQVKHGTGIEEIKTLLPFAQTLDTQWENYDEDTRGLHPSTLVKNAIRSYTTEKERREK